MSLSTGAATAHAQAAPAVSLDPDNARLGTSLVLGLDTPAAPLVLTLPGGTRFDPRAAAAGAGVGFGSYAMNVEGFLAPGGDTQLVWSLAATLGASPGEVTIKSTLLGADTAAALLAPQIGAAVPTATTTTARFARSGGRLEFRLDRLPVAFSPPPPTTVTPARLELSLGAGRRVRQTFYHRIRVPTPSGGSRVRRVRDHRLVAHDLLRTPPRCSSTWAYTLRAGGRTASGSMPCLAPAL